VERAQKASSEAERRHHLIPGRPVASGPKDTCSLVQRACESACESFRRYHTDATSVVLKMHVNNKTQLVGVAVDRNIKQPTWHVRWIATPSISGSSSA
jgi:hypothetical protein